MPLKAPQRIGLVTGLIIGVLALGGCSSAQQESNPAPQVTLNIAAAASLRSSFEQIADEFSVEHPEVKISGINYDGSATLATQIIEGAPVDVFAAADERTMAEVSDAGLGEEPVLFASNTMVIAVPQGNPAQIATLADLSEATTVLCAAQVPCGAATVQLLEAQELAVRPVSEEQNVTAVLQKVIAGEADAGLVYATDVRGEAAVEAIIPEGAQDVVNNYPITALPQSHQAQEFVDFVIGERGQQILAEHGFVSATEQANG